MGTTKPQLEKQLSDILRGSVRVPALLSNAPKMVLGDLNLSNYTILPVEPLNDIKGRMITFSISSGAHITWMMKYVRHWKTFLEPTYTKRRKKAVIVSIHAYLHTTH